MNFLEKDLEDLIWDKIETGDFDSLITRGLTISRYYKYYRQPNLGAYGIPDIIGIRFASAKNVYCHIIELKKEEIGVGTLLQAVRYGKGVSRYFKDYNNVSITFIVSLIGKTIHKNSDFIYLPDVLNGDYGGFDLRNYTYSFDFDTGLRFIRHSNYVLKNESLPEMKFSISELKELYNHQIEIQCPVSEQSNQTIGATQS